MDIKERTLLDDYSSEKALLIAARDGLSDEFKTALQDLLERPSDMRVFLSKQLVRDEVTYVENERNHYVMKFMLKAVDSGHVGIARAFFKLTKHLAQDIKHNHMIFTNLRHDPSLLSLILVTIETAYLRGYGTISHAPRYHAKYWRSIHYMSMGKSMPASSETRHTRSKIKIYTHRSSSSSTSPSPSPDAQQQVNIDPRYLFRFGKTDMITKIDGLIDAEIYLSDAIASGNLDIVKLVVTLTEHKSDLMDEYISTAGKHPHIFYYLESLGVFKPRVLSSCITYAIRSNNLELIDYIESKYDKPSSIVDHCVQAARCGLPTLFKRFFERLSTPQKVNVAYSYVALIKGVVLNHVIIDDLLDISLKECYNGRVKKWTSKYKYLYGESDLDLHRHLMREAIKQDELHIVKHLIPSSKYLPKDDDYLQLAAKADTSEIFSYLLSLRLPSDLVDLVIAASQRTFNRGIIRIILSLEIPFKTREIDYRCGDDAHLIKERLRSVCI